jgi:hypothetical protein
VGANQIRGGGISGRSIRAEAVGSPVQKTRPAKSGIEKASELAQNKISVEHETAQQLRGCDSCPHGS